MSMTWDGPPEIHAERFDTHSEAVRFWEQMRHTAAVSTPKETATGFVVRWAEQRKPAEPVRLRMAEQKRVYTTGR